MILYGAPFISVEDWKNDTIYKGKYSEAHKVVVWFWEVVR